MKLMFYFRKHHQNVKIEIVYTSEPEDIEIEIVYTSDSENVKIEIVYTSCTMKFAYFSEIPAGGSTKA